MKKLKLANNLKQIRGHLRKW